METATHCGRTFLDVASPLLKANFFLRVMIAECLTHSCVLDQGIQQIINLLQWDLGRKAVTDLHRMFNH